MYCISGGPIACKALFYNCDIALLRYGFYRQPAVVLKNFKLRLFRLATYDLIVASAISLVVALIAMITGIEWGFVSMAMFIVTILLLSLFFTVHHLCMYYIFQPYTTDLKVKNPFFNIINTVIYLLCFFCLNIETSNEVFSLVVLISTIVYIIVGLLVVYKFSAKTFRVK